MGRQTCWGAITFLAQTKKDNEGGRHKRLITPPTLPVQVLLYYPVSGKSCGLYQFAVELEGFVGCVEKRGGILCGFV